MNCPACGNAMTDVTAGDVKVSACKGGCGGLWFEAWALRKVEQPEQSAGRALLDIPQSPQVKVDRNRRRKCPRDPDVVMMRHFWSVKRQPAVDECPTCAGVFLDPGELREIRSEYQADDQRHKAAGAYYRGMFDSQLAEMLKQDKSKVGSARNLLQIFKFIGYEPLTDWKAVLRRIDEGER